MGVDPHGGELSGGQNYRQVNARAVDVWVTEGWEWGTPISSEEFAAALTGDWQVVLTPLIPVPREWFGDLRGRRVLGLASGGGQQMPIFAAQGAVCTVLDIADSQLAAERMVAEREGYDIDIVQADMTERLPFDDDSFDLIFHPVSNCYIEDVQHVWDECARVLRPGGVLLAGMDNGINFVVNDDETAIVRRLPYNPLQDPELYREGIVSGEGVQFSHTFDEQIGGQLRAGFRLAAVYEDLNSAGRLRDLGIPSFWASRAVLG